MANYLYIDNFSRKGRIGISLATFNSIVETALNNVQGVAQSKSKLKRNQNVYFNKPVQTSISRGILHISAYIDVKKGSDIQVIDKQIHDEVETALLTSTEQVPFDIQVKVVSLF